MNVWLSRSNIRVPFKVELLVDRDESIELKRSACSTNPFAFPHRALSSGVQFVVRGVLFNNLEVILA